MSGEPGRRGEETAPDAAGDALAEHAPGDGTGDGAGNGAAPTNGHAHGEDPVDGEGAETEPAAPAPEPPLAELMAGAAALLFASPDPLSLARLSQLLGGAAPARVREALAELSRRLDAAGLPIELRSIAGGWRLLTAPGRAELVGRLARERRAERISPASLETLSIVAYRQPVTKAEIEAIRGVQCGPILRALVDRGFVRILGRADQPGSPLEYGTTRQFLDQFGLGGLDDLPRDAELVKD